MWLIGLKVKISIEALYKTKAPAHSLLGGFQPKPYHIVGYAYIYTNVVFYAIVVRAFKNF